MRKGQNASGVSVPAIVGSIICAALAVASLVNAVRFFQDSRRADSAVLLVLALLAFGVVGLIWRKSKKATQRRQQRLAEQAEQTRAALKQALDSLPRAHAPLPPKTPVCLPDFSDPYTARDFRCYAAAGVEQYEFMAGLDEQTCEICGRLDGQIFSVADAKEGVNCPPMHEGCRCTTVQYDPNEEMDFINSGLKMPKRTTYQQWKETQQ